MHGTYTDQTFYLTGHLRQVLFHRFGNVIGCLLYSNEAIVPTLTITAQSQYSQPLISKILERVVHQQLYEFLSANELLTPNQFSFGHKLSTATALAHFTDNILQSRDKGGFTGAVFLDLSKAFDTVVNVCLVKKLKTIGASSQVVKWFASYLESQYQVTSVENCQSTQQLLSLLLYSTRTSY